MTFHRMKHVHNVASGAFNINMCQGGTSLKSYGKERVTAGDPLGGSDKCPTSSAWQRGSLRPHPGSSYHDGDHNPEAWRNP